MMNPVLDVNQMKKCSADEFHGIPSQMNPYIPISTQSKHTIAHQHVSKPHEGQDHVEKRDGHIEDAQTVQRHSKL